MNIGDFKGKTLILGVSKTDVWVLLSPRVFIQITA